jgi:multiple sugar transport system permease protein
MITPIIVGLLWRFMLNDQTGLVNYFLAAIRIGRFAFLSTADSALLAIIVADLWQWTPFVILLLYSCLQALPKEPYEAAELDGATELQKFWHITLPALRNTMVICVLIRAMDAFREYFCSCTTCLLIEGCHIQVGLRKQFGLPFVALWFCILQDYPRGF